MIPPKSMSSAWQSEEKIWVGKKPYIFTNPQKVFLHICIGDLNNVFLI